MSRTIAITSGKGGVGKTNVSLNLGLCLAQQGHRTCLFDADFGLANINILLGLQPEYDLKDVIQNGKTLQDILIRTDENIHILPGSSGLEELANLTADQIEALLQSLSEMAAYDFLIFDTSAGISRNVITLCLAASELLLVITPEPTSLTDGFALLKVLKLNGFEGNAKVLVNQCKTAETAQLIYQKFSAAATKYLDLDVVSLGMIYPDANVVEAVKQQRPFVQLYPDTSAARCIREIATRLLSDASHPPNGSDTERFWKRLVDLIASPLTLPLKKKEGEKQKPATKAAEDGEKTQQAAPASQDKTSSGSSPHGRETERTASQVHSPPSPGQPNGSGSPVSAPFHEGALMPLMERLIGSISSVSKELQQLRETIEGNGNSIAPQKISGSHEPNKKPIRLDVAAFVESRNASRKES
jgi:flagellar biosynthesis protein FlhG